MTSSRRSSTSKTSSPGSPASDGRTRIPSWASPTSTVHQLMVLPFFCGSGSMVSTRPMTSGPVMSWPGRSSDSSLRPRAVSRWARSSVVTSAGRSAYSRIQETGAFMRGPRRGASAASGLLGWSQVCSERGGEADVALEHVAHVGDAVAEHQRAVDAHAEREAGVAVVVDAARGEHARVDHAAAAPLDPALALAGATVVDSGVLAAADEAAQVDLGGGLGEGEVRRTEAGADPLAEHRRGEVVEGALEVGHGDALVDAESFDLVEHRAVRRVVLIGAEDPTGRDDVD